MAPERPVLQPLKTPKTPKTPTLPSEIQCVSQSDTKTDKPMPKPITPPLAYTQFLKAMKPEIQSPISPAAGFSRYPIEKLGTPSTTTTTSVSFPHGGEFVTSESGSPESPVTTPLSAKSPHGRKRLRVSTVLAARKAMSPATASPRSASTVAYSPYSPAEWRMRYLDGPQLPAGKSVTVREVITRTVTYRRASLEPTPQAKRRRTSATPQA
ncbi:hypothetical protein UA08_08305 [Talaromyces atroroseus]|uniref:Uncharacterized protein n=1 Tax=Talaromyces atroroseus TaxID=1441469 RepID=A0A225ACC5_TALAT|nr:hypothetical protein UA08_08305 [Talaromyces atroroseus]OKL56513.1 hypothetical protein UA08_08305 [Talaromyces atroroseus]